MNGKAGLVAFASGLALLITGFVVRLTVSHEPLTYEHSLLPQLIRPLSVLALLMFVLSCAQLARAKGYPVLWGAIGLLGPFGVAVIACLPNRYVRPAAESK